MGNYLFPASLYRDPRMNCFSRKSERQVSRVSRVSWMGFRRREWNTARRPDGVVPGLQTGRAGGKGDGAQSGLTGPLEQELSLRIVQFVA